MRYLLDATPRVLIQTVDKTRIAGMYFRQGDYTITSLRINHVRIKLGIPGGGDVSNGSGYLPLVWSLHRIEESNYQRCRRRRAVPRALHMLPSAAQKNAGEFESVVSTWRFNFKRSIEPANARKGTTLRRLHSWNSGSGISRGVVTGQPGMPEWL